MTAGRPDSNGPALDRRSRHAALPGRWPQLLRDGFNPDGPDETPWGAVMSYANACASAGRTEASFIADLMDGRNRLHDAIRYREDRTRRTDTNMQGRLRKTWAKALARTVDSTRITSRVEAHQRLAEIRDAVACTTWTGRTAIRDRTVMLALLDIGDSLGSVTPRISIRTLTEDTPYVGMLTTQRALAALTAAGWVHADRKGCERTEASTYRLDTPPRRVRATSSQDDCPPTGRGLDYQWHTQEVVRARNDLAMTLGVSAATLHAALTPNAELSVADLISRSGITRRTAYRWLPKLEKLGLAVSSPDGWLRGDGSPADVASDLGVDGKVKRRAERHELQRAGFRAWVEARDADVGPRR